MTADEQELDRLRNLQSYYLEAYEAGDISKYKFDLLFEMYSRRMLEIDPNIN